MFGTLHPDEVEDMLFAHHVGHLDCIAARGPYIVPITFAHDGCALYGHTVGERKLTGKSGRWPRFER